MSPKIGDIAFSLATAMQSICGESQKGTAADKP